jgi:hypothetical protein
MQDPAHNTTTSMKPSNDNSTGRELLGGDFAESDVFIADSIKSAAEHGLLKL